MSGYKQIQLAQQRDVKWERKSQDWVGDLDTISMTEVRTLRRHVQKTCVGDSLTCITTVCRFVDVKGVFFDRDQPLIVEAPLNPKIIKLSSRYVFDRVFLRTDPRSIESS